LYHHTARLNPRSARTSNGMLARSAMAPVIVKTVHPLRRGEANRTRDDAAEGEQPVHAFGAKVARRIYRG
jgi:hypothetical protein